MGGRKEGSKEGRKHTLVREKKRWNESEIALSVLILFLFSMITVVKREVRHTKSFSKTDFSSVYGNTFRIY